MLKNTTVAVALINCAVMGGSPEMESTVMRLSGASNADK